MSLLKISDPVENFLERLPDPHADYMSPSYKEELDDVTCRIVSSVELFVKECDSRSPSDRDAVFLYRTFHSSKASGTWSHSAIRDTLLQWAHRTLIPPGESLKARHLKYISWITRGRKDQAGGCSLLQEPKPGTCASCPNGPNHRLKDVCQVATKGRNTLLTYYCSPRCQKAHMNEHTRICNFLTQLNRGLSMFDEVLSLLQETVRYKGFHPLNMQPSGGNLEAELPNSGQRRRLIYTGAHIAVKIPASKSQGGLSLAALANNGAVDVIRGPTRPLLDLFLDPILSLEKRDPLIRDVEIVDFWPKNIERPIYTFRAKRQPGSSPIIEFAHFNSIKPHKVIRICFTNGSQVAIDLSRRQFGWREYLADWKVYAEQRIYKIIEPPSGVNENFVTLTSSVPSNESSLGTRLDAFSEEHPDGAPEKVLPALFDMVVQGLVSFLHGYVEETYPYGGMGSFLLAPDDDFFERTRAPMMDKVEFLLDSHAEAFKKRENFRFYLDHRTMTHKVALDGELCYRLKNVWLSEEEYNKTGGDEGELRRLWEMRWNEHLGPNYRPRTLRS